MNLDLAACTQEGVDPDWFTPDDYARNGSKYRNPNIQKALDICESCPLKSQCLRERAEDQYSIIGGTTPPQRGVRTGVDKRAYVDHVAVDLAVRGHSVRLHSPAEKIAAARKMYREMGMSAAQIVERLGVSWATWAKMRDRVTQSVGGPKYARYMEVRHRATDKEAIAYLDRLPEEGVPAYQGKAMYYSSLGVRPSVQPRGFNAKAYRT